MWAGEWSKRFHLVDFQKQDIQEKLQIVNDTVVQDPANGDETTQVNENI